MLAKIIEFCPPKKTYLAFVSLREKKVLIEYLLKNFSIECKVDEGEVTAIEFKLTPMMVKKLQKAFPNAHILEGTL